MDIFHQDGTTQTTVATSKQDAATQTVQTSIQKRVDKRGPDETPIVHRPFQIKITDFAKRIRGAFTPNLKPRKSKFLKQGHRG